MAKGRTLLYEGVLDYVKQRVTNGTYQAGERLPSVATLARDIGVGISTVREGIRVLESLGLVKVQHGRGIFVSSDARLLENPQRTLALTEDALLLCIMEVRRIYEPEAAALAAERATSEQAREIMRLAEEQERQILLPGGDPVPADFGFHRLLVEAARNPVLAKMVGAVEDLLLDGRRRTTRIPVTYAKSIHYHYLIGHAVEGRDSRQARSLMQEHINDLTNDVRQHLEETHGRLPPTT